MLLNARKVKSGSDVTNPFILLAIEDATEYGERDPRRYLTPTRAKIVNGNKSIRLIGLITLLDRYQLHFEDKSNCWAEWDRSPRCHSPTPAESRAATSSRPS